MRNKYRTAGREISFESMKIYCTHGTNKSLPDSHCLGIRQKILHSAAKADKSIEKQGGKWELCILLVFLCDLVCCPCSPFSHSLAPIQGCDFKCVLNWFLRSFYIKHLISSKCSPSPFFHLHIPFSPIRPQIETHVDGERVRYFQDDDNVSLKEMVRREKMSSAQDQNALYSRMAAKVRKSYCTDAHAEQCWIQSRMRMQFMIITRKKKKFCECLT